MARVQVATQAWGVLQDRYGNVLAGSTPTITDPSGNPAVVYATATGTSTVTPTTDSDGRIPGYVGEGPYTVAVGVDSYPVQAVAAATTVESFGADGANPSHDDTAAFQAALTYHSNAGGGHLKVPFGNYKLTSTLNYTGSNLTVELEPGAKVDGSTMRGTAGNPSYLMTFSGSESAFVNLTATAAPGASTLSVSSGDLSTLGLAQGDLIHVVSDSYYDPTTVPGTQGYRYGEFATVESASGTTITLLNPTHARYRINATTTLNGALTGSETDGTVVTVASTANLDDYGYITTVSGQQIHYGQISGNTLTNTIFGWNGTTKAAAADGSAVTQSDNARVAKVTPAENITVKGGEFVGVNSITAYQTALTFVLCRKVRLSGTRFTKFDFVCAGFDGCYDFGVSDCHFDQTEQQGVPDNGYGVHVKGPSAHGRIENNHFKYGKHSITHGQGVVAQGVPRYIDIVGNTCIQAKVCNIDAHGVGENIQIIGNTCVGANNGIGLRAPKGLIVGNTIRNCSQDAIFLRNQSGRPSEYIVANNQIKDPGTRGILYQTDESVSALVATVGGKDTYGIAITGNQISLGDGNATPWGIQIFADSTLPFTLSGYNISDNVIFNAGIRLIGVVNSKVSGNEMNSVPITSRGILLQNPSVGVTTIADTVDVHDNQIAYAPGTVTAAAIELQDQQSGSGTGNRVSIRLNTVTGGTNGAKIANVVTNCAIVDNDFSQCSAAAILGTGAGNFGFDNRGPVVAASASASPLILPSGRVIQVTGTADITSIQATFRDDMRILRFTSTAATNGVVDGSNLKLNGNFAYTADDTLTIVCDGTNWYEAARSAN